MTGVCKCGGEMTNLDFPIKTGKAKARWLGISLADARQRPGVYRFVGLCCAKGCKRITGSLYAPDGELVEKRG